MKTSIKSNRLIHYILYLIISFSFISCISSNLKVSEYKFIYKGETYLIRSAYSPYNPESNNKIIGDDFVAVDMDQDRVMDKVVSGNTELIWAQEIYDFCLNTLEKYNKLNEINRGNGYFKVIEKDFDFKIKTFYPKVGSPFNEFTILDKRSGPSKNKISFLIDKKADGNLDELVKGGILLKDANNQYKRIIKTGLANRKLKKIDNLICVP